MLGIGAGQIEGAPAAFPPLITSEVYIALQEDPPFAACMVCESVRLHNYASCAFVQHTRVFKCWGRYHDGQLCLNKQLSRSRAAVTHSGEGWSLCQIARGPLHASCGLTIHAPNRTQVPDSTTQHSRGHRSAARGPRGQPLLQIIQPACLSRTYDDAWSI